MMKRYLLALGGTGSKVAESLVWAACAGVLQDGDGPIDEVRILCVDPDESCGNAARAAEDCAAYARVQAMMAELPCPGPSFRTRLSLETWDLRLPEGVCTAQSLAQGSDSLLCDALLPQEAAARDMHQGLGGQGALGAWLFARALEQSNGGTDDALTRMMEELRASLAAGERAQVLLCGSTFGGTGAAGIPALARYLRDNLPGALAVGAVLMLPYCSLPEGAAQEDRLMDQASATLAAYGRMGLRPEAEGSQALLDAAWLLGVPEGCMTPARGDAAEHNDAHLLEWLAVRCAAQFFRGEGARGCFYYRMRGSRFTWGGFAEDEARYRRAYGGLLKLAALFAAEFGPALEARLRRGKRDRALGYYAAYFPQAHRSDAAARQRLLDDLAALRACLQGYAGWVMQVVATLPPPLRDVDALEQVQAQAAENYRRLLDAAGHLALMEDEIHRSGMEEEKTVRRGAAKETAADQLLRAAQAKRQEVERLAQAQAALDRRTGGQSKLALMARMARGIDRAMAAEESRAQQRREAIRLEENEAARLRMGEALYRLETHLHLLVAQRARVQADQRQAEADGLRHLPPQVEAASRFPGNDLFDRETLEALERLMTAPGEDRRAFRRQAGQVAERAHRLVLPEDSDDVTAAAMVADMGDGRGSVQGASPLGCFLAQALHAVMKEGC